MKSEAGSEEREARAADGRPSTKDSGKLPGPLAEKVRPEKRLIFCKDCGEPRPHKAKGLCERCYNHRDREKRRGKCPKCGHENVVIYNGACENCRAKAYRKRQIVCAGCGRPTREHARGYCAKCYPRLGGSRNNRTPRLDYNVWLAIRRAGYSMKEPVTRLVNEIVEGWLLDRGYLPLDKVRSDAKKF